jgi:hypothetical protein
MYPLCFQNCQSASLNTRNGFPLDRSFNFEALLFAVEGFPGMSLWALLLLLAIVGTIVGTIPFCSSLLIAIEFIICVFDKINLQRAYDIDFPLNWPIFALF